MRSILIIMIDVTPRRTCALALTLLAATLAACGSDSSADTPSVDSDAPTIVATMSIWADVTSNVACDGLAQVVTVIPPGGDPHAFEPSIRDRETMERASLVVANGLNLEESLNDTLDAVESKSTPVLRVAEGLDPLHLGDEAHDDTEGVDHDHGDLDPHVWWDPTRVAAALPAIEDALVDAGLDRAALDTCVARYRDELATLDADVAAIVAPLPTDRRLLVTNHDSLGYFADRYDFDVIGAVIPSSSTLAESSPSALEDLAAKIRSTGVPAIFAETQHSSADTEALAKRIGGVDVVTFATDTLGPPGSETGTYIGWLQTNARAIVDALTPGDGN